MNGTTETLPVREFTARRRVEFADTDMGGIVHFARYLVFVETAEHDLLRSVGVSPGTYADAEGRHVGWPRVAASCEYLAPARYGDELAIHLRIVRKGSSSLTYGFEIRRGGTALTRGRMTIVQAWFDAPGGMRALPIPPEIAARLEEAPAEP